MTAGLVLSMISLFLSGITIGITIGIVIFTRRH